MEPKLCSFILPQINPSSISIFSNPIPNSTLRIWPCPIRTKMVSTLFSSVYGVSSLIRRHSKRNFRVRRILILRQVCLFRKHKKIVLNNLCKIQSTDKKRFFSTSDINIDYLPNDHNNLPQTVLETRICIIWLVYRSTLLSAGNTRHLIAITPNSWADAAGDMWLDSW